MIDILLQSRRNQVVLDVAGQSLMFTSVRALGPTERAAKPAAFSGGGGGGPTGITGIFRMPNLRRSVKEE